MNKLAVILYAILAISSAGFAAKPDQIPQASQTAPKFLDIARYANGDPKYMYRSQAIKYCACSDDEGKKLGCTTAPGKAHLPSARELAQLTMSMGARGIVNGCDSADQNCYLITNIQDEDGTKDEFFYSSIGYKYPSAVIGSHWFWSSSVNLSSSVSVFGVVLYGYTGELYGMPRHNPELVRCVVGR